jgi:hypothetical protein
MTDQDQHAQDGDADLEADGRLSANHASMLPQSASTPR